MEEKREKKNKVKSLILGTLAAAVGYAVLGPVGLLLVLVYFIL